MQLFQQECVLEVTYASHNPHLSWHGVKLGQPDWSQDSRSLAFSLHHPQSGEHLHVMLNAYWETLPFELPVLGHHEGWFRIVDTSLTLPDAVCELESATHVDAKTYLVSGRSSVVLMIKPFVE